MLLNFIKRIRIPLTAQTESNEAYEIVRSVILKLLQLFDVFFEKNIEKDSVCENSSTVLVELFQSKFGTKHEGTSFSSSFCFTVVKNFY